MSFPRVYREIKEMAGRAMLETPMARAIMRKAGLRIGGGTAQGISSAGLLLSMTQVGGVIQLFTLPIPYTKGVIGIYPPTNPETIGWPANTQHTLVYLPGLAYTRVVFNHGGQSGETPSAGLIAFVPIYTSLMNPMSEGNLNAEGLEIWITPDGRTLYDWHLDSQEGGPQTLPWPPAGSVTYAISSSHTVAGRWARPPLEALGESSVLLGVGVISRVADEDPSGVSQVFVQGLQVFGLPEEWNTDAFQGFYASQIDD